MNNIVLLATYWNEIEWINASLEQIEKINPVEVIICDGCFDPNKKNYSTDGTSEIIKAFSHSRKNVKIIPALRLNYLSHLFYWLKKLPNENCLSSMVPRLKVAKSFKNMNLYRLNQMATFNYMISISKYFKSGNWFMTYDCDQFYDDAMIGDFNMVNEQNFGYDILTSKEITFFSDFDHCTEDHEQRDYNNMPHKIFNDLRFIPTRHPARVINNRYEICSTFGKKMYLGYVYHYHLKSKERLVDGYSLGNRQPPSIKGLIFKRLICEHPAIIKKHFL
ncbi:hypothetical protein ACFL5V_13630 [Fibrobacterota bacterium]